MGMKNRAPLPWTTIPDIVNSMTQKRGRLSNTQLARLSREVIRDGLVRPVERTAGKKCESVAETGKPVVINAIHHAQVVLVHDDQNGRHFLDSRQAGNLIHQVSGITALENAKKMEELGGWTMMSAPTPSARVRQSAKAPEVSPTISRTRNTCSERASTLSAERSGRTPRLLHRRCQIIKPL